MRVPARANANETCSSSCILSAGHRVKLVVFAHTPPPHHGQSYMVGLLLDAFAGGEGEPDTSTPSHGGIACYHVDARYSTSNQDVGQARFGKVLLALRYSAQAIWFRLRFKAR